MVYDPERVRKILTTVFTGIFFLIVSIIGFSIYWLFS